MSDRIHAALLATLELTATHWSDNAVKAAMVMLRKYPEAAILNALAECSQELKGKLRLSDITERLPGAQKMTGDQAWDIALKCRVWDEDATIVCPAAVFYAFPFSVWNSGDQTGARVAFRDAFPEMLKKHGLDPYISDGLDPLGRRPAIEEAIRNGTLPKAQGQRLLGTMRDAEADAAGRPRARGTEGALTIPAAIRDLAKRRYGA